MSLPPLISVDDFLRSPERSGATISPDGTRIAYLAPWKNRANVWIEELDSGAEPRCVTADDTRTVRHYFWTHDPRWLLYLQDDGGDENWHVFRVHLDDPGSPAVDLTPFPGALVTGFELSTTRRGKATLQLNARAAAEFDLYELDIATGELTVLVKNPGNVTSWLYAGEGRLFATTIAKNGDHVVSRRDPETGTETEIDSHPTYDLDMRSAVLPMFPPTLIRNRATGTLLGARYFGMRQVVHALDDEFADVLKHVETLSNGDLAHLSSDDDGRRWIVSFTHDREGGTTWFYDHATGQSRILFRLFPHLDPDAMAPMTPVTIAARDGLELPSYLTLPVGIEPTGLPLVLLVHGGPWARDAWGFDRSVQLLANRGYAVLQVNFRGSGGLGKAHMQAAIGEFAGKMHDDLIDAVDWAVDQGYADPDRVGIFGGSYGGYATLVGVTFTPDRFAAACEYVGISDLSNFMRTLPRHAESSLINNWYAYVGDPDDPAQLEDMLARSPITKVDRITTPLMVVQGANDVRVVQAESDNLVEALRARGVEVDYTVFEDEGHIFANPDNLVTMFRALDRFFARHLGGRRDV